MVASMRNVFLICTCLFGLIGAVQAAEPFNDPTRPAFDLVPGLSSGGVAGDASDKVEVPPLGLQSVIISPAREAAIINGTEVERGGKYGDAELIVVNETCVVLMGPQGRQVMHMFPTVNMTKNELACVKRQGMQPIIKAQVAKSVNRGIKKKPRAKKTPVVCAPEVIKDGSKK